jgi:hypothetical protein
MRKPPRRSESGTIAITRKTGLAATFADRADFGRCAQVHGRRLRTRRSTSCGHWPSDNAVGMMRAGAVHSTAGDEETFVQ